MAAADMFGAILQLEATSDGGSGSWSPGPRDGVCCLQMDGNGDIERLSWHLIRPIDVFSDRNPDQVLATLESATVTYINDPQVNMDFAVQAGTEDTEIKLASSLLSFPTIYDAEGVASAAYTVADLDGDGVTLTGIGDTGGAYLAQYNGWAAFLLGTTFAEVIETLSADAWSTDSVSVDVPETGTLSIDDPVYDMSALAHFNLTANDLASGTTTYVIVPEPGSLLLLVLGLAAAARVRR
jgi:hypothetical protein